MPVAGGDVRGTKVLAEHGLSVRYTDTGLRNGILSA